LLVTISGLPGSGTTTVSRLVADALGVARVNGGEVFRAMAAEAGLSLADFGELARSDRRYDEELDRRLVERAAEGGCVIESRLAGWLVVRAELVALRTWVDCSPTVRAERVASRDEIPVAQALEDNAQRAALERARYQAYYDIDLQDMAPYDLVLDSTATPAEQLADRIVEAARRP